MVLQMPLLQRRYRSLIQTGMAWRIFLISILIRMAQQITTRPAVVTDIGNYLHQRLFQGTDIAVR